MAQIAAIMAGMAACGTGSAQSVQPTNQQAEKDTKVYYNTEWDQKTLKVLAIGNSYTEDALMYLYDIASAYGVEEVEVANLYIGSCTLERHCKNAESGAADYVYMKNDAGKWVHTPGWTLLQGIQDEDWDFIVFHQESMNAGLPDSYDGNLEALVGYVQQHKTNPKCKLVWNLTWAYSENSPNQKFSQYGRDQEAMYTAIVSAAQQKVLPLEQITIVIPSGTVVQNGRSYFGNVFTRDEYDHLNDFGKLLVGYMWYVTLTGEPLLELKYEPTKLELTEQAERKLLNCLTAAFTEPFDPKE